MFRSLEFLLFIIYLFALFILGSYTEKYFEIKEHPNRFCREIDKLNKDLDQQVIKALDQ